MFPPPFVEQEHPRAPRGAPGGGRFVSKGGTPEPSKREARPARTAQPSVATFTIPDNYRQFRSAREASGYGEEHYRLYQSLALDEAIERINPYARDTIHEALLHGRQRQAYEDDWNAIDTLDEVLQQSVVPESLVVHRALDPAAAQMLKDVKVGDTVALTNFTTTSLMPLVAMGDRQTIKILVNEGYPGLLTPTNDLILPRGGEMRLLGSDADGLVFKWNGAIPEKNAARQLQKEKDLETLNYLHDGFPNLTEAHQVKGYSPKYNCMAWAVGDDTKWWGPGFHWPLPMGTGRHVSVSDFDELFVDVFHGKELTPDPKNQEYEKGFVKLAVFDDGHDFPTHMARLLPSGQWQSKFGGHLLANHGTDIRDLNGGRYGDVNKIYKLDEKDWRDIKDFKPDDITLTNHAKRLGMPEREAALGVNKITFSSRDETEALNDVDRSMIITRMKPAIRMLGKRPGPKYKENKVYVGTRGQWHAHVAEANNIEGGDTDEHHFSRGGTTYERGFVDPASNIYYKANDIGVDAAELRAGRTSDIAGEVDVVEHLMKPRVAQIEKIAKQAAFEQGYDPNKVHVDAKPGIRRVGNQQWAVAASATDDGEIQLHALAIQDDKRIPGFVAHEVEHQKYWRLMDDTFAAPIGSPLRQKFDAVFVKPMDRLRETATNISEYATSWWKAAEAGAALPAADIARNETLAEIARVEKETGKLPPNLSREWMAAYDLVNQHWKEHGTARLGSRPAALQVSEHDGQKQMQVTVDGSTYQIEMTPELKSLQAGNHKIKLEYA